jgi:methylmalonyl-CoA mutase cobalamin-binding subunit
MRLPAEWEVDDIVVVAGGVIQANDVPGFKALGLAEIFDSEALTGI